MCGGLQYGNQINFESEAFSAVSISAAENTEALSKSSRVLALRI